MLFSSCARNGREPKPDDYLRSVPSGTAKELCDLLLGAERSIGTQTGDTQDQLRKLVAVAATSDRAGLFKLAAQRALTATDQASRLGRSSSNGQVARAASSRRLAIAQLAVACAATEQ